MINRIKDYFRERGAKKLGEEKPNVVEKPAGKIAEHQKIINEMLAAISVCKMDDELKMILRMRIWGKDPWVFAPMTHEEIAMDIKCRVDDVKRWERDAIENVKTFLSTYSVIEATEKFNKDLYFKKILQPEKRIIG